MKKTTLSASDQIEMLSQLIKSICSEYHLDKNVVIQDFVYLIDGKPPMALPFTERPWKLFYSSTNLEDQTNCLVVYKYEDDTYSIPHIAYWDKDERGFFSLLPNHAIPLYVDFYMEIPEVKE